MDDGFTVHARATELISAGERNCAAIMAKLECSYGPVLRAARSMKVVMNYPPGFWKDIDRQRIERAKAREREAATKTDRIIAVLKDGKYSTARDVALAAQASLPMVYHVAKALGFKLARGYSTNQASAPFEPMPQFVPYKAGLADPPLDGSPIVNDRNPITVNEQNMARDVKERRLKLELARQLEEILARQKRIWGFC